MFKCFYCTQKYLSSTLCEALMKSLEKFNCAPFTWLKYIVPISLINISKKVNLRTAQKYKCIRVLQNIVSPLYVHYLTFWSYHTRERASSLNGSKKSCVQVIYMKGIKIHSPFLCRWQMFMECWKLGNNVDVQRLGKKPKQPNTGTDATWNENHLWEARWQGRERCAL